MHMIIWTDGGKAFDKNPTSFNAKETQQTRKKGNFVQSDRGHLWKSKSWNTLNTEKSPLKIRTSSSGLSHHNYSAYRMCQPGKLGRTKNKKASKLERKETIFTDDNILYIKNHKEFTKKSTRTNEQVQQLQDTKSTHKNQLNYYPVAINNLKIKLRIQICHSFKKI